MKITKTLKEKSKEICSLSVYVVATILITSPLAFATPFQVNQGTVNTKFRTALNYASGCSPFTSSSSCFTANTYDNLDGVLQGFIAIDTYSSDYSEYSLIACSGPAYANIVSVNQANGNTSVKATLNPSDPSCYTYNWKAGTVTVNLSGIYTDGGNRSSNTGQSAGYYNGRTYKYNYRTDSFDETFTGSITGFTTPFIGSASTSRTSNFEQVK